MKKRIVSLLCVLALCLGLLPVTVLAAEEIKLFIGGQQITESGCYENQNGTWTKVDGTEPANGQFYYDADTFTLTLNEAEITNNQTVNVAEGYTYDGSVIAFSQTADVSLTIVVSQGRSTITGNGGIRVESTTGDVSLSIAGPGSLDVEPKGSNSGITLCGSKNMNLDIDGADVTASSPAQYGVYLISSADASSTSTITVNNGSLTTGGNGNVGIYYYWSGTNNAGTSSLTVSGNAVVDTRNSQIMAQNKETVVQVGAGSDGNGGIVFNGKNGTVYGKVELQEDLTINEGEKLTIKDGSSLNTNGNMTNNGTINVESGGKLEGTPDGSGTITIAPTITTTSLPEGEVGTAYSQTLTATGDTPITWSVSGTLPAGLSLEAATGIISGTPTTEKTSTFTVTATNDSGSDSKEYTLTIKAVPVTGVALDKTELALFTGESETLTATVEPGNATNQNVTWSSDKPEVATVEDGKVTAVAAGEATITVTTADDGKQATCQVKVTQSTYSISADTQALDFGSACPGYERPAAKTVTVTNTGNRSLALTQPASTNNFEVGTLSKTELAAGETATFTVQPKAGLAAGAYSENIVVSASNNVALTIPASFTVKHDLEKVAAKAPTCTEAGNKECWVCKVCGKYFDTDGKTEITRESTVIPAAGHKYENGKCTVCGAADPNFQPTPAPTATPAPTSTPLPYYILHFNTMGGYPLADVTFGEGAPVELWPYNPTRPGYLFMGWYEDEALTKPVSVVVLVRETTVYAKWAVDPAAQTSGSGTGSSSGSGSGSGTKATATPSPTAKPTATPAPTPTVTPTPTATPESTPAVTPAPDETGDKGGFPVLPVALGAGAIVAGIVAVVILRRRV